MNEIPPHQYPLEVEIGNASEDNAVELSGKLFELYHLYDLPKYEYDEFRKILHDRFPDIVT